MPRFVRLALAGGLVGILVGALVGLSNSPVVGTVLGAIIPVVVLIAGAFATKVAKEPTLSLDDALSFVGWFAGSCLLAVLVGMFYRTSNVPSVSSVYNQLIAIGAKEDDAQKWAAEWLKANPEGAQVAKGLVAATGTAESADLCLPFARPSAQRYDSSTLEQMKSQDNDRLTGLAEAMEAIPGTLDDAQALLLSAKIFDAVCE